MQIERNDTCQCMNRVVAHRRVIYLGEQVGEANMVADQTRDCLSRVDG